MVIHTSFAERHREEGRSRALKKAALSRFHAFSFKVAAHLANKSAPYPSTTPEPQPSASPPSGQPIDGARRTIGRQPHVSFLAIVNRFIVVVWPQREKARARGRVGEREREAERESERERARARGREREPEIESQREPSDSELQECKNLREREREMRD
ncbi:hypothetical protein TIFTF001_028432 [Ficus carica]|uniref:Uncharacterized protein n=1 Tax=Ficus carica TaxID=3494 RepID=A0AA88DQ07_FICCA|nr:hypothetical protein TIFTF001_028432 [Ficus carica]